MLKILIVDDSALMRRHLTQLFEAEGGFIIHHARNGNEAVVENREFKPDVLTLDINMPEMDGISALSLIMAERPVPVIMVSSLTTKGALATFEALNLGAVDFVAKPGGTISMSVDDIARTLIDKVKAAAKARLRSTARERKKVSSEPLKRPVAAPTRSQPPAPKSGKLIGLRDKVVIIGVSTGGPRTLEDILPALPANLNAAIVIAQHMPASFTASLASRLDRACKVNVQEVSKATPLESGTVYIGRGSADITLVKRNNQLCAQIKPEDNEFLWHPSVELLGRSALRNCSPEKVLAIMLTGMGHDGSKAFSELHRRGAMTIAESEETAIVFGMPQELIALNGAGKVLPAQAIANEIIRFAGA